jgi:hypothetical protein
MKTLASIVVFFLKKVLLSWLAATEWRSSVGRGVLVNGVRYLNSGQYMLFCVDEQLHELTPDILTVSSDLFAMLCLAIDVQRRVKSTFRGRKAWNFPLEAQTGISDDPSFHMNKVQAF